MATMELLKEGAGCLGLILGPRQLAAFETYYRELTLWNQRFNLTAISGYEEVQCKHLLDSLSCILAFPQQGRTQGIPDTVPLQRPAQPLLVIDVGSGAGFPGLPLKIMLPDIRMTLLEATAKKATFLRHMVEELGLQDVEIVHGRAEEVGQAAEHRERYDLVVARAVATLPVLLEYCLPLCRVGGRVVAQKGDDVREEVEIAQNALHVLGSALLEIKPVVLPCLSLRHLVVVDKMSRTPSEYPRRPGIPSKRPL
jgi:16S rRNA (guanine527-N7)-methyltransferase